VLPISQSGKYTKTWVGVGILSYSQVGKNSACLKAANWLLSAKKDSLSCLKHFPP